MAKEKITVINKAGHAMRVSPKFAQGMGLKEKPKVLAKPPEIEAIKPRVINTPVAEPIQVVKIEPVIVEPEIIEPVLIEPETVIVPEPTWDEIKKPKPTRRKR